MSEGDGGDSGAPVMERIIEELTREIEEIRKSKETYSSWIISIYDREDKKLDNIPVKNIIKKELYRRYPRKDSLLHHTTIIIFLRKNELPTVSLENDPIWIAGRYRKNQRGISNTPITLLREKNNIIKDNQLIKNRRALYKEKNTFSSESLFSGASSASSDAVGSCEETEIRIKAVSDWVLPFREYFMGTSCNFMSSGREDIDVRMLGEGRPFLVRIDDPSKNLPNPRYTLLNVLTESNTCIEQQEEYPVISIPYNLPLSVELLSLRLVDGKKSFSEMKKIEESKKKEYYVSFYTKMEKEKVKLKLLESGWVTSDHQVFYKEEILLKQKTPIRVLHRRANILRERKVYNSYVEVSSSSEQDTLPKEGSLITSSLTSDAGTYIKEFVNGDFSRTSPSFSEILQVFCDVVELDVLNIHGVFPNSGILQKIELRHP
ncbi:tRNA pseudouridine synthase 10 [Nematocida sp. LUAm3]|nr:tRNA pseudouridine synthase 10 [Nematocida sp. LUAm3]KAI5175155.1 tRNA pseudouridine synthase 10 [Nematocida sp. LUAm2]KAI5178173.1 tRNA pseudouridine synthase 10 [Nematocida sp. LUAm1]